MSQVSKDKMYLRQTTLKEVGNSGQQKLQEASVCVVGCGGLGSVAAIYLAASGVGNLHLIDFDTVDLSNLHRQVFYRLTDVGKSKAEVLSNYIHSISPFVNVSFTSKAVDKSNVVDLILPTDFVLDCTDFLPVKYLLNDACVIHDKILVYGSLYKFDGYIATFNSVNDDGTRSSNLRDAFPEIPIDNIPNCSELGTLNTIVGIIGLMQANEVLKIVTDVGKPLTNQLLIYNTSDNSQYRMKLKSKCSKEVIVEIFATETYVQVGCEIEEEIEMCQATFNTLLKEERGKYTLVSVIENTDQELPFGVDEQVPLSLLENWISDDFNSSKTYVFVCNRGISSMIAATNVKHDFPETNVFSLEGGVLDF
jgi:molybdopterin/thiamine biosynthesis adenylyltransferase/rhodanese-related sulfurtransferase